MTTISIRNNEYKLSLDIRIFKKRKVYIAYCPSLDIATSAKNKKDLQAAFEECLQSYLDYCIENGTLHDDLIAHGWKFHNNPTDYLFITSK